MYYKLQIYIINYIKRIHNINYGEKSDAFFIISFNITPFLITPFNHKNPNFKKTLNYHKEILYATYTKKKEKLKKIF